MVLGLLYNTYLDATESSKYYENNDDVLEDYNVNDFLLTLGACAINQPLTYAMLYLLLNQKKNEKRWYTILGLAINVTMISIAWIVIPILTTSYCCEASAMWAFGIIFIVLVEIIVFETLHALMRYFLKVKV